MRRNVFIVSKDRLLSGEPVTMQDVNLRERAHLQEWLLTNPDIIEQGFYVLTSEFAEWRTPEGTRQADRLDILGVDVEGRIVVVELKRGPCPDATDMQSIKYAALASQFTVQMLLEAHAKYLRTLGREFAVESIHELLPAQVQRFFADRDKRVGTPRIILIAESFGYSLTSSVAFLNTIGKDGFAIKLIEYEMTRFASVIREGDYVVSFRTLFPPRGLESFVSTPHVGTISQAVESEALEREARQQNIVVRIVAAKLIPVASILRFRPPYRIDEAAAIEAWLSRTDPLVTWTANPRTPLAYEGEDFSPTGLAKRFLLESTGNAPRAIRGPEWWTFEDRTLVDIATAAELSVGPANVERSSM